MLENGQKIIAIYNCPNLWRNNPPFLFKFLNKNLSIKIKTKNILLGKIMEINNKNICEKTKINPPPSELQIF